jgi:hypothetical protein
MQKKYIVSNQTEINEIKKHQMLIPWKGKKRIYMTLARITKTKYRKQK